MVDRYFGLSICLPNMGLIWETRGDLCRLTWAIPSSAGNIFVKQVVPGDLESRRPDLDVVIPDKKHALVVDVMVPFEGSLDAHQVPREAKRVKYMSL